MKNANKPKQLSLTKVQEFYIQKHIGEKPMEDVATDLGLPTDVVTTYAEKFKGRGNFGNRDGIAIMTEGQSQLDDEITGSVNSKFYEEHSKNIHRIDENKPFK